MKNFFSTVDKITYEGSSSSNKFSYKYYNPEETINNKRMEDHLRFAACYWHNFVWPGTDPFGGDTFERPWFGNTMKNAKLKADIAFEMFNILNIPYFCFHDHDVRPEGTGFKENTRNLNEMVDYFQFKMEECKVKLLWGTANLFSHPRYMNGASTNPNFEVVAYAAAQVKNAIDATIKLGGQNYVFWGGREGYMSLLNTNMKKELEHLAMFLTQARDYGRANGFNGTFLIEPKPMEPMKHQYDFDSATVIGFLREFDLVDDFQLNVEVNHATLAQHTFQHELQICTNADMLGSIDANRGDYQNGWDTDQFPINIYELVESMMVILKNDGFSTGGINFDAKVRRNSTDLNDIFISHISQLIMRV